MSDEQRPEGLYWVRMSRHMKSWGPVYVDDDGVITTVGDDSPLSPIGWEWSPRVPSPDEEEVRQGSGA